MDEALALAGQAAACGEIPVGALVVDFSGGAEGVLIGAGFNLREREADASAHAEIVAIRQAGKARGSWRLDGCTLYVTLEPCPMCAGAIVNGRLDRVVYGCADPKAGAVETLFRLCGDPRLNHRVEAVGGVRAEEAAELLRAFFAARRGKGRAPAGGDLPANPTRAD
ncbi:MAG TPA: nucleoside deaminase [Phycisphaerae bacterium]|nr:nucleoside deaminase [Phycisphaerae bacterium]